MLTLSEAMLFYGVFFVAICGPLTISALWGRGWGIGVCAGLIPIIVLLAFSAGAATYGKPGWSSVWAGPVLEMVGAWIAACVAIRAQNEKDKVARG